jgi:hypothetical protein
MNPVMISLIFGVIMQALMIVAGIKADRDTEKKSEKA